MRFYKFDTDTYANIYMIFIETRLYKNNLYTYCVKKNESLNLYISPPINLFILIEMGSFHIIHQNYKVIIYII